MRKQSGNAKILAIGFVLYIVLDVLLTPVGGLETRPASDVTTIGFISLGLLFVGLALFVVSLALLSYRPRRVPILAVIGGILYFPAFLTDQTGVFSTLRPPAGIAALELVQALVAIVIIVFALRARGEKVVSAPST